MAELGFWLIARRAWLEQSFPGRHKIINHSVVSVMSVCFLKTCILALLPGKGLCTEDVSFLEVAPPLALWSLLWCGSTKKLKLMSSPDTPPPPVYFLSLQAACESAIQRWPSARVWERPWRWCTGLTCQLPSASVIIHSSSVRSFCKRPWRACTACAGKTAGFWNALWLSSPGSTAASVLHGGTVFPNKESEWILVTRWRLLPLPPPARLSCSGTKSALVHLCRHSMLTSTLTQLPLLRRGWKSMTRSLVIRIWPSTSGWDGCGIFLVG